jgi:hypothetical protein
MYSNVEKIENKINKNILDSENNEMRLTFNFIYILCFLIREITFFKCLTIF